MSLVSSLAISALLLIPVVKHEIQARDAERIKRIHAEGLIPCESDGSGLSTDRELLAHLPATPSISITANPSFDDIESVHLVGREIFYVRRQHPISEIPRRPMKSRSPKVLKVSKETLSENASGSLIELIESDIAHAAAEWPMGLDGITYYFETPEGCAAAWSPDGDTRAGKMVDLFWHLAARASNSALPEGKSDDAALLKMIKRLQSGSQ
jgi:hypothetical protein